MTSHKYHFEDTIVNPDNLLDSTREAVSTYDMESWSNQWFYFHNLLLNIFGRGGYTGHDFSVQPYAKLEEHKSDDYSSTEAVVWQNPWATPISPKQHTDAESYARLVEGHQRHKGFDTNSIGKLIMADLTRESLKQAGVTDKDGKPLPVIAFSSPSNDWQPEIPKGVRVLDELGSSIVRTMRELGFKTLHLAGTSMGASVMGRMINRFGESPQTGSGLTRNDLNIKSAVLSESPSFRDRGFIKFAKAYALDTKGMGIKGEWTDQAPRVRRKLAADGEEAYEASNIYAGNLSTNLRAVNEMRKNILGTTLDVAKVFSVPLTVEFGTASKISEGIDRFLDRVEMQDGTTSYDYDKLQVLQANGCAPHAHTENPVYMADVITRSVLFAKENE